MPELIQSLLKQDIGHLRIIAEFWGLALESVDVDSARDELAASLLDLGLLAELMDSLSSQALSAITDLVNSGGRIPWPTFTRKYGDIREMGAGKRDRERPHLKPSSTAEILFYRGILARAFFETDKGSQEFAYIPDDLFLLVENCTAGEEQLETTETIGRPASPKEQGMIIPANDHILDDATTMLAALRTGRLNDRSDPRLQNLLASAKLIIPSPRGKGIQGERLNPETVKTFLEASRADALKFLTDAWIQSASFNELKLMPGIVCEGEWSNPTQETREFLLNLLEAIPAGKWWSLGAFIRDVKANYADFQRPAGDYDSWFIRRESDGVYLRGFSYWDQVDGALIRFFITNILHWLGQVDLSVAEGSAEATAFRIRPEAQPGTSEEKGKISVSSNGRIGIERGVPRAVRYQVARFCEWGEEKPNEYKYQITAQSLKQAREQGLKAEQLLSLLAKHTNGNIPPSLIKALKRWEANGAEVRAETQVILKVSRPEVLEEIRRSKTAKYLGEVLSPTAVVVKSGAIQKVMEALNELGLLMETEDDEE